VSSTDNIKQKIMDALMGGLADSALMLDYEIVETYTNDGDPQAWIEIGGIKFTVSVADRED
jgi:hypothetical protein